MRGLTIAYTAVAIWVSGWLAGLFGLLPVLFLSIIVFAPAALAWRIVLSRRPARRREYGYLGVVTLLAVGAAVFLVDKWHGAGMDRLAMFDREYDAFCRRVDAMPEYRDIEISYTRRKGGRVYLHGSVATRESHDRLVQMLERMVRNNDSGYYDGVGFPGRSIAGEPETIEPDPVDQTGQDKPQ